MRASRTRARSRIPRSNCPRHLTEVNERLARQGIRTISLTDPDHIERFGLEQLAREHTLELKFEDEAETEAENENENEADAEVGLQADYEARFRGRGRGHGGVTAQASIA